jgi:hypothetical protein
MRQVMPVLYLGLCTNVAVVSREVPQRKSRGGGRKDKVIPGRVALKLDNDQEAFIHPSSLTHR